MGIFDNIIDDTAEVQIKVFGELIILLHETNIQEFEIIRYALKHASLPDESSYNDYKDEIDPNPSHIFFTKRANRYIPKIEKWCNDNNFKIINLNIIKEGKYPEKYEHIDIPDKPEFKFNYLQFLKYNWSSIIAMFLGMITIFTVIGCKIGYKLAYVELARMLAVNNVRPKAVLLYIISMIPLVVYLGFVTYFLINLAT